MFQGRHICVMVAVYPRRDSTNEFRALSSVGTGMSMQPSSSSFPVINVAFLVKKLNKPFSAARNAVDAFTIATWMHH